IPATLALGGNLVHLADDAPVPLDVLLVLLFDLAQALLEFTLLPLDPVVHVHDDFHAGQIDAQLVDEPLNLLQPLDVLVGIQPDVAYRARGVYQPDPFVMPQRLRVHADHPRGYADHVVVSRRRLAGRRPAGPPTLHRSIASATSSAGSGPGAWTSTSPSHSSLRLLSSFPLPLELLEQVTLAGRKVGRQDHPYLRIQVAGGIAPQRRQALSGEAEGAGVLGFGGDLHAELRALEGGHVDLSTQHGLR